MIKILIEALDSLGGVLGLMGEPDKKSKEEVQNRRQQRFIRGKDTPRCEYYRNPPKPARTKR